MLETHFYFGLFFINYLTMSLKPWIKGRKELKHNSSLSIITYLFLLYIYFSFLTTTEPFPSFKNQVDSNTEQLLYAIVFDAGSTGTRIHVFSYRIDLNSVNQARLILEKDHFYQVKPGLSSYNDNPEEAAISIIPLLDVANQVIPVHLRKTTPLFLKATAGLRLLSAAKADQILQEVRKLFESIKPSYLLYKDSVSMLSGEDEGIYGWLANNYHLKILNNTDESHVVFDLGGGSTQVTFGSPYESTLNTVPSTFLTQKNVLGETIQLYTHSYLGFGQRSARKGVLLLNNEEKVKSLDGNIYTKNPCFPPGYMLRWKFEGNIYNIIGKEGDCMNLTYNYIKSSQDPFYHPSEIKDKSLLGISFFYELAVDIGIVNQKENAGTIRIVDYYLAASKVCNALFDMNAEYNEEIEKAKKEFEPRWMKYSDLNRNNIIGLYDKNPFVCLDLSYVSSLLNTGHGINWHKQIKVADKISGFDTSWPLGLTIDYLSR